MILLDTHIWIGWVNGAIESTQLPGPFHKDPADETIIATAQIHNRPLLTADSKLLSYPHVQTLK